MNRLMKLKSVALVALSLVSCTFAACSEDGEQRYSDARALAKDFHNFAVNGRYSELSTLIDYPFNFDQLHQIESEAAFQRLMEKKGPSIGRRARPATAIEVVSYEKFLAGEEVAGVSLSEEVAEAQALKIGLVPGCYLIRCYHEDSGRRDARGYWLVARENSLGDLKVVTYYD
jgi:hypothetical protein